MFNSIPLVIECSNSFVMQNKIRADKVCTPWLSYLDHRSLSTFPANKNTLKHYIFELRPEKSSLIDRKFLIKWMMSVKDGMFADFLLI